MKFIKTKRVWLFSRWFDDATDHQNKGVFYLLPTITQLKGSSKENSHSFAIHVGWGYWALTIGIITFDKNHLPQPKI